MEMQKEKNKNLFAQQIRMRQINEIWLRIYQATLQDRTISIKLLRGEMAMAEGLSNARFDEYLTTLEGMGRLNIDGDAVWAKPEVLEATKEAERILGVRQDDKKG